MRQRYSKNAGALFSLKYHIVWCSKYRRDVLKDGVDIRLKALLQEKASQYAIKILKMEVMPDHVHLFVESDPTMCVSEIVNRLKGYTSRILRSEFSPLRTRIPTLWSRSYYAGSVGSMSESVIQKYIESQKGK